LIQRAVLSSNSRLYNYCLSTPRSQIRSGYGNPAAAFTAIP